MDRTTEYKTTEMPAVNRSGIPTTYISFSILELFFNNSRTFMSVQDLNKFIAEREKSIASICRQLHEIDFIEADPFASNTYKYKIHCENYKQQCNFEKFLLDSKTNPVPVHKRLRYSPAQK